MVSKVSLFKLFNDNLQKKDSHRFQSYVRALLIHKIHIAEQGALSQISSGIYMKTMG